MRLALIHDWLWGLRGGERCLETLLARFPEADVYTLFYQPDDLPASLRLPDIRTSVLNRLPQAKRYYRYLLPAYPLALRSLSNSLRKNHLVRPYDAVLSISHSAVKNIAVPRGVRHVCYCLTPMRYIWDQYERYFGDVWWEPAVRPVAAWLRSWDVRWADGVDEYVAISKFVQQRISDYYGRVARVIYPPVDTSWLKPRREDDEGEGFLAVSALVPYKNLHLVVEAFNSLGLALTIVGRGPEGKRLKKLAKNNIKFIDYVSAPELAELYRASKAMIFAAEEDFGMTPVEMQAAGRPVICYGSGGSLETVKGEDEGRTGLYFRELSAESIVAAVREFLDRQCEFTVDNCVRQAEKFSSERFSNSFSEVFSPSH